MLKRMEQSRLVISPFQDFTVRYDGADCDGYCLLEDIEEELRVQPKQVNSGGVTIYDRATSQPYCMYIEYGKMYTSPGECLNSSVIQPAR